MTDQLNGTFQEEGVSDEEQEERGGEGTGHGAVQPPPYAQLSQHFAPLERAEDESGNREAVFHLQKDKMAMIKAHASTCQHGSRLTVRTRPITLRGVGGATHVYMYPREANRLIEAL